MNYLLNETHLRDLDRLGYCFVREVLDADKLLVLSTTIDLIAKHQRAEKKAWFSHENQRIFMLLNCSDVFFDLIDQPLALELATGLLGPDFLLSSITANIATPSNKPQQLHADQGYLPEPWLRAEAANFVWALDDFTETNGATRVVPGSHKSGIAPTQKEVQTEPIIAPSGSLICLDGRVWHGTGENTTSNELRRAIFAYYCRPYIRQQENFSRSLKADLRATLSSQQRQLLGFDIWQGLGAVDGLPVAWMDGRERIGPTNADGIFPDMATSKSTGSLRDLESSDVE